MNKSMDKNTTAAALQEAILLLEIKQAEQAKDLKEEFHDTYERLKPAKNTSSILRDTVKSPVLRDIVISKTVDVALVLLTNIILRRKTGSLTKRTLGTFVVWGIKNIVTRNPDIIKKAGIGILNGINQIITKRNRNKTYAYTSRL